MCGPIAANTIRVNDVRALPRVVCPDWRGPHFVYPVLRDVPLRLAAGAERDGMPARVRCPSECPADSHWIEWLGARAIRSSGSETDRCDHAFLLKNARPRPPSWAVVPRHLLCAIGPPLVSRQELRKLALRRRRVIRGCCMSLRLSLLVAAGFVAGCFYSPGGSNSGGPSRPDSCRDVYLFVVSGHTFNDTGCDSALEYNCEYLEARGTTEALRGVFESRGESTNAWHYTDNLLSWGIDENGDSELQTDEIFAFGFLSLLADMEFLHAECVDGYSNGSRIVVAAHSHGTVWAHSAVLLLDHVPVEYLIDLDGNALCWESDLACGFIGDNWAYVVGQYIDEDQPDWWFDVSNPSDSWEVEGFDSLVDLEDIAPPNARFNIEARANGALAFDNMDNYRFDGSRTGIYTGFFNDDHSSVTQPGAEPFEWVLDQLWALE